MRELALFAGAGGGILGGLLLGWRTICAVEAELRRGGGRGDHATCYRPTAIGREVVRLAEGEGDPEMRSVCAAERMRIMRARLELLADGWERAGARAWEVGCVLERAAADRPYGGQRGGC